MKSRWSLCGLGGMVSLALATVTLSGQAFAQPADESNNAPSDSPSPAPATDSPPSADTTAKPAADGNAEAAAAPAAAAPEAPAAAPPPAADELKLTLEVLPGTAYPEPYTRGLKFGSLWLTMHGLQWPYLPAVGGGSSVRVGVSGSLWDDTSYARIESNNANDPSGKRWLNQGRAVLRVSPTYSRPDDWFVQGQVELVGNIQQNFSSGNLGVLDDLYVRIGKWNLFDVTVGRFQGWEVYHYGMGLDLNSFERNGALGLLGNKPPPAIYGLDTMWDRPSTGAGNYAAHIYFTKYLRGELLGQIGVKQDNLFGLRPVGVLDLGVVKIKAGYEYQAITPQSDKSQALTLTKGYGGAIQFVLNPYIEGGVNAARRVVDSKTSDGLPDLPHSTTTWSVGGFINARIIDSALIGLGANWTDFQPVEQSKNTANPNFGKSDDSTHLQTFFALQYTLFDRYYLKFVGNYAAFHFEDRLEFPQHNLTYKEWGGRFRVQYIF